MSDIGTLTAAASKAQAALTAAKAEQAALAATAAEDRKQRSIAWAFLRVSTYPQAQAEANYAVTEALAAFDVAVTTDYGSSPAAYLAVAKSMALANGVGAEYTAALSILRAAGAIANANPGHRPDPVGYLNAPYPASGLPTFAALAESAIEAARAIAFRLPPPADDPGAFSGPAPSDAERRAVFAYAWVLTPDLEHLLGHKAQYPEHYARSVPEAQQIEAAAYAAGRLARGYDADLPKVVIQSTGAARTPTARELESGWTLRR